MFPPCAMDLVPDGHLAHFIRNVVSEQLDLSEILESYAEERGYPPYHPVMMTAVMLYANAGIDDQSVPFPLTHRVSTPSRATHRRESRDSGRFQ